MIPIFDINAQYYAAQGDALENYRRLLDDPEMIGLVVSGMDLRLPPSSDFPFMSCFATTNEQFLEFAARLNSPKLVPFCFIDPRQPDAATRLTRYVQRHGFRGVKMYPPQGWYPDEPRVLDAFRTAEALRVPVFLHMGRTASHPQLRSVYAMPHHLEGLGLACPRLNVILGHFAAPWSMEAVHLAMSFPFYFDLSTSGHWDARPIRHVVQSPYLGIERLLLGTNNDGSTNLQTAQQTLHRLYDFGLSDAQVRQIACGNALKLLGLDASPAPASLQENHASHR